MLAPSHRQTAHSVGKHMIHMSLRTAGQHSVVVEINGIVMKRSQDNGRRKATTPHKRQAIHLGVLRRILRKIMTAKIRMLACKPSSITFRKKSFILLRIVMDIVF